MTKAIPEHPGQLLSEPDTLIEVLQNRTVYKVYRKVVQETEDPQTLRALELLHALQSDKSDRKVVGLVQKILDLELFHFPHLQGLKKRLTQELSKGKITNLSIKEVTLFLSSLLDPSFHNFWSEMNGRLKDYGVEQPGDEGWARLEPILQVLTSKMVLKRLRGRKNNVGHQAQMQPTVEDIRAFNRALQLAAEGWPTPEVLHFLRYLQTHGTEERLPLLENNLLCCLEVQKYKNAHHAMPDRGLLRRKVQVVRERFLPPDGNSVLQVGSLKLVGYVIPQHLTKSEILILGRPPLSAHHFSTPVKLKSIFFFVPAHFPACFRRISLPTETVAGVL